MNIPDVIASLERTGTLIAGFCENLGEEEARWKEAPERWSMLEILCHLCDEERDDFRMRIELTLDDPACDWPPVEPERWARERDYNARDLAATLDRFRRERERSIGLLRGLRDADWNQEKIHPLLGPLKAGDLLVSWAAHDLLHLRQMANTRLARMAADAGPYSTGYAVP